MSGFLNENGALQAHATTGRTYHDTLVSHMKQVLGHAQSYAGAITGQTNNAIQTRATDAHTSGMKMAQKYADLLDAVHGTGTTMDGVDQTGHTTVSKVQINF
jgi:hypothetical protein